jgi:hypothetical protein
MEAYHCPVNCSLRAELSETPGTLTSTVTEVDDQENYPAYRKHVYAPNSLGMPRCMLAIAMMCVGLLFLQLDQFPRHTCTFRFRHHTTHPLLRGPQKCPSTSTALLEKTTPRSKATTK